MIYYGTEPQGRTVPALISASDESESEIIVDTEIKMEKVEEQGEKDDTGVFAAFRSTFDRFCYSGVVIDEAQAEGQKTIEERAENFMDTIPEKGMKLMQEGAVILQSQSEVVQIKAKEGLAVSMEAIQNFPDTFKTKWAEAKVIYEQNKKVEAENKKFEEEQAELEAMKKDTMELEAAEDEDKPPVSTVTIP